MTATSPSTRNARALTSSRLPMGVATIYNTPSARRSAAAFKRCALVRSFLFALVQAHRLEAARLELPMVADLRVIVVIVACTDPVHIVAGIAQLHVAAAGRAIAALEFHHVIVNVRAWRQRRETLLIH